MSAPARLLVRIYTKRELGAQLVSQHSVGRVDTPQPRIAEQLLERTLPEDSEAVTIEETAQVLGVSVVTVKRDWTTARAWLYREVRDSL